MRSKQSLAVCLMLCAALPASAQANPARSGQPQANNIMPHCAALWVPPLDPGTAQAQAPPPKASAPPASVKAPLPPVGAEAPPAYDKAQTPKPEIAAPSPRSAPTAQAPPVAPSASKVAAPAPAKLQPPASTPTDADSDRLAQSNDDYSVWRNDYLRRLYEDQRTQSWVIFFLVLLLVAAGLFFSWLQFQHAFLLKKVVKSSAATKSVPNPDPASTQDELTFGKDGVVIRSAYLGVIILVLSMAFFFLYLKYVYPIT